MRVNYALGSFVLLAAVIGAIVLARKD